jgi:hypothetical protein
MHTDDDDSNDDYDDVLSTILRHGNTKKIEFGKLLPVELLAENDANILLDRRRGLVTN